MVHETIHHCIEQLEETMDEAQEEATIFWMQWYDSELIYSDFDV